ncbi:hypothetical protein [Streptomyces laurentii]|uniref:hypothetical protein n=1 Tax=Streptomyces laurentii TaxID=39478 RepID=UPI0036B7E953
MYLSYKSFITEELLDKGRAWVRARGHTGVWAEIWAEVWAEGWVQGYIEEYVENIPAMLDDVRGFSVPDTLREHITDCTDLAQLRRWLRRAATVSAAEDIFTAEDA